MKIKDDFVTQNFCFVNYIHLSEVQNMTIWQGRNEDEVRRWMVNKDKFSFEEHLAFVSGLKERNDRTYWACLSNGEIIGSFCLNPLTIDTEHSAGEMGKYLLPAFMGKGFGSKATKEFVDYVLLSDIVDEVYIKTLVSNERNQHVNAKAGFHETHRDETYVYMSMFKKDIK